MHQGHLGVNLPEHLKASLSRLSSLAADFFNQTSEQKNTAYPASHGTESGYYNIEDEKEYLTFRRKSPGSTSDLDLQAEEVWETVAVLLYRILCDISTALGIPHDAWNTLLEDSLAMQESATVDPTLPSVLRLFKYQPKQGVADRHTDNGLLTLCVGNSRGLQVWKPSTNKSPGEWTDADGPTVLVGSTLRVLSSNRCKGGVHRVISSEEGRSSIVFALRPCLRYGIELERFGGFGSVHSRQLYGTITARKTNVNARKTSVISQGSGTG